jgi:hypothetical protein
MRVLPDVYRRIMRDEGEREYKLLIAPAERSAAVGELRQQQCD